MKELGRIKLYDMELSKITKAQNLPPEWATPEQRSRAALKALGTGVAEKVRFRTEGDKDSLKRKTKISLRLN